jgi:hypothetical protein
MKFEPLPMTVAQLLKLREKQMLRVNPEYQRGPVWTKMQRQKLIDSILRGYSLPKFYLHKITSGDSDLGLRSDVLEVIDGQQRILALEDFVKGGFNLLDPCDRDNHFPEFLRTNLCPWAERRYRDLETQDRQRLDDYKLSVDVLVTENPSEARDLFIRLQAGTPLSPQERRDAWPGGMCTFIIDLAGKEGLRSGHRFFEHIAGSPARGKHRQLAAKIVMLLRERLAGRSDLVDTKADRLDDLYYTEVGFDPDGDEAKAIRRIFERADVILRRKSLARLREHTAIHLLLLIQALETEYSSGWEHKLPDILAEFEKELAAQTVQAQGEIWERYGQHARTGSEKKTAIERRDAYFTGYFLTRLDSVARRDPRRAFTEAERRAVFYRDSMRCQVCGNQVLWGEAEIDHYPVPHGAGGPTILPNARLVHGSSCHSRGKEALR